MNSIVVNTWYLQLLLTTFMNLRILNRVMENICCQALYQHALKKIKNDIYLIGSIEMEGMQYIIDSYISYNPAIESSFITGAKYLPQLETADKILQIITDLL